MALMVISAMHKPAPDPSQRNKTGESESRKGRRRSRYEEFDVRHRVPGMLRTCDGLMTGVPIWDTHGAR
jgi:hypothetical protein